MSAIPKKLKELIEAVSKPLFIDASIAFNASSDNSCYIGSSGMYTNVRFWRCPDGGCNTCICNTINKEELMAYINNNYKAPTVIEYLKLKNIKLGIK